MEQNQARLGLEASLIETKKDRAKSLLKAVAWTSLPVLVTAGTSFIGVIASNYVQDNNLKYALAGCIGVCVGTVIGRSGMVKDYANTFRDCIADARYALDWVKGCKTQLKELR